MEYNNTFLNGYLCMKIYTNCKRIYKLIENFLDFDSSFQHSIPRINVSFYLDEIKPKNPDDGRAFFHQMCLDTNKNLFSSFSKKIATVMANPKTGIVKGTILNYEESSKEPLLDFIFMQPLRFILVHYGLFFFHASVVCKDKNCILIIGPQDSGKSTLALVLSQNGFNLLSDDDCYVKLVRNQPRLFPFPTKIGLTEKLLKKYPQLNRYILKNYRYGGKRRLSLNSLSNCNNIKDLRCKMIIFSKYKEGRNICMKQLTNKEALAKLIKENSAVYPKKEFQRVFETLCSLTREVNSFELIYNDDRLNKIPTIIRKFGDFI